MPWGPRRRRMPRGPRMSGSWGESESGGGEGLGGSSGACGSGTGEAASPKAGTGGREWPG